MLGFHDSVELGHRNTGLDREVLGFEFIVHQRIAPARVLPHDISAIAGIDPQDPLFAQCEPGANHVSPS